MTENRLHPDLNCSEEYNHSGHSRNTNGVNVDAEGYIKEIPALNAPGGLASAGYENCHFLAAGYSFVPVAHAADMVNRLVDNIFVVEHRLFKRGGRLHPMLELCVARLIASYNEAKALLGHDNYIVKTIRECCVALELEDPKVT